MNDEKPKLAKVIPMQSPHPLQPEHVHGTPNPEDSLIEMIDSLPKKAKPTPKLKPLDGGDK